MQFLQERATSVDPSGIQMVITTHSPNLAYAIDLDNLVLIHERRAFPLACGETSLAKSDYGFLARFLDVTKANLFFCCGLLIVEGDAENILLPVLARLLNKDLTEHGVSIVNVGGTGLRRFARIFLRNKPEEGTIRVPVACITDLDVMPDCGPEIVGQVASGEAWPAKEKRHWRARRDYTPEQLLARREEIKAKARGQSVETFVAEHWTFEYDLAFAGLLKDLWTAAHLAEKDEQISAGKCKPLAVLHSALRAYAELTRLYTSQEERACHAYALFTKNSRVSKATAAQYLASLIERRVKKGQLTPASLAQILPVYLVDAIQYVTSTTSHLDAPSEGQRNG
jgi:putative ATP-dependent endonuclease of OLD family